MFRLRRSKVSVALAAVGFVFSVYSILRLGYYRKTRNIAKDIRAKYTVKDVEVPPVVRAGMVGNVVYNRVGKCGSRSMMDIAQILKTRNRFELRYSADNDNERPAMSDSIQTMMFISSYRPRLFYVRHTHYMDFKKYGMFQPIYINMIRDPIDRFVSQYNYLKYGDAKSHVKAGPKTDWPDINDCVMKNTGVCNSNMMFYIGMYFCGLDKVCEQPDDPQRVHIAKKHIDEDYIIVGLLEEFDVTLLLLEKLLPDYFKGAVEVWGKIWEDSRTSTATKIKDVLTEEAREKLRNKNLADEYEVYYHAKDKFERLKNKYLITNL